MFRCPGWGLDCGGGQGRLPAKMWEQRLREGERNSLEEWFLPRGLEAGAEVPACPNV